MYIDFIKSVIESFAIDLIHNVKILLIETIKSMAQTKQFKRFIEKMFLNISNISLEATIEKMKDYTADPKKLTPDAQKMQTFLKDVKNKINETSNDKSKLLNIANGSQPKVAEFPKTENLMKSMQTPVNKTPIKTNSFKNSFNTHNKLSHGGTAPKNIDNKHSGGSITDTTKYIIEPRIFPDIPDITPELMKKHFYVHIEPFLNVMTCKNCNNGMFVRIKNKIICNLMKLFSTLLTLLFKTDFLDSSVIYGSFKRVLDKLSKNPDKINELIIVFKNQLEKNNERLKEIEEEEMSEFDNLTGADKHEKMIREKIEKRDGEIDKLSQLLEQALIEIKEDEYLPGKDRDPENVHKRISTILNGAGESEGEGEKIIKAIEESVKPGEVDETDKTKMKYIKKNEELKKNANTLLRELRSLKRLPYYDGSNDDDDLNPNKLIKEIKEDYGKMKKKDTDDIVDKNDIKLTVSDDFTQPASLQNFENIKQNGGRPKKHSTFKNRKSGGGGGGYRNRSSKSMRAIAA